MQYEDDFVEIDLSHEMPTEDVISCSNPDDSLLRRVWSALKIRGELLRK
ncbi:hypothetical protein AB0L62_33280 [Nocardia asteroides]